MKAIRVDRYGEPKVLELEDISVPARDPNELLVKVAAAGVGPWDTLARTGKSGAAQTHPLTPGSDIAGVVDHGVWFRNHFACKGSRRPVGMQNL
jgi:NADPH:quinone reductase-like Zn-dependent oxidoreductase